MSNFTDPIKVGFGRYLQRWHAELIGDTPAMREYVARDFSKAAVWAPGRMIDQVEEMLNSWRKNDTSQEAQPTPYLPMVMAAMSKDYLPAPAEYTMPVGEPLNVTIPSDTLNRVFRMRVVTAEIRTQIAIAAPEEPTARSLALQLHAFMGRLKNRRFYSPIELAGFTEPWPVVVARNDPQAINTATEAKNLTLLAIDVQLYATIPLLTVAKNAEPNDGKGDGTADDPHGFMVVTEAQGTHWPGPGYLHPKQWTVTADEP